MPAAAAPGQLMPGAIGARCCRGHRIRLAGRAWHRGKGSRSRLRPAELDGLPWRAKKSETRRRWVRIGGNGSERSGSITVQHGGGAEASIERGSRASTLGYLVSPKLAR